MAAGLATPGGVAGEEGDDEICGCGIGDRVPEDDATEEGGTDGKPNGFMPVGVVGIFHVCCSSDGMGACGIGDCVAEDDATEERGADRRSNGFRRLSDGCCTDNGLDACGIGDRVSEEDGLEVGGTDGMPNGFEAGGKFNSGAENGVGKGENPNGPCGMPWGIGANGVLTLIP